MVQNYTCPPPMPNKKSSPQNFGLYQTYEKCIMNIIDFLNEKTQHNDSSSLSTKCVGLKCVGENIFSIQKVGSFSYYLIFTNNQRVFSKVKQP